MPCRLSATGRVPELIQAAVKVLGEKVYCATQMADVAAEMGVAAGSLYNYVDSKEGLFALCLERMAQGPSFQLEITLPFGHHAEAAARAHRGCTPASGPRCPAPGQTVAPPVPRRSCERS